MKQEPLLFQQDIDSSQRDEEIFGSSEALLPALAYVPRVAATDYTVLITGEIGTGKELVARAIHKLSHRSSRAFVRANCAAIPRERIASELLGCLKGSWSQATQPRPGRFQLAEGGTIFLEGIADLSAQAQVSLLRVLQEIESDPSPKVRLIAATDRDLPAATANGTFRRDLFDRLNRIAIKIPPLRERKADIPMLARYFLNRYAGRSGNKSPSLPRPAMDLLQSYPWPGNIREFQSVMERFVSFYITENSSVAAKCIPLESISACTSFRSISRELALNQKELLENASSGMLAEFPG